MLITPFTGVGNYVQQLLAHLLQIDHANQYWLLAHREIQAMRWLNGNGNAALAATHFPNRLVWMQCLLPFTLRALDPDVMHFPNFVAPLAARGKLVVTVHDLALLRFPELFPPRQRIIMRPLIAPTVRRARAIITVSKESKRDIVRTLRIAPSRVHVIYEAAAPIFYRTREEGESARRLTAYGWDPTARHLLYVGTVEPRKNLTRLVSALQHLHRRGNRAHLWVVGQAGWHADTIMQRAQELGLAPFVHLTGYIALADLIAFYQSCDVFVLPSLHEGFGLPVMEAMACGAPVAVSDTPALREIADEAALNFDPTDEEAMATALYQILADDELNRELRRRARARAQEFSWTRAARETLAVYEAVVNSP